MKTFKDIEKEFERLFLPTKCNEDDCCFSFYQAQKTFIKEISNQIIDECIGEKKKVPLHCMFNTRKNSLIRNGIADYNTKVQELKEYKTNFNK